MSTKTWRLGGTAGYSVHAVGTETRGKRVYTHVELHNKTEVICRQQWWLPGSQAVELFRDCLPPSVSADDVEFLCGLVRTAYAQRALS